MSGRPAAVRPCKGDAVKRTRIIAFGIVILISIALVTTRGRWVEPVAERISDITSADLALIDNPRTPGEKIVNGAKMEANREVHYDASYIRISYPNGDVPANQGACTDVLVRALRNAGYDLQKLIHEDMLANWSSYPHRYGLTRPDANIDHRRVPNHLAFLRRHGRELPTSTTGNALDTWQPGDLVYWKLGELDHCGVISNERSTQGLPLVIHNIGPEVCQADCLTSWRIVGHFRFPPDDVRPRT